MSEIWQRLSDGGLTRGEPPPASGDRSPWFVKVMLAGAGWIGAWFLLGSIGVGLVFVMESKLASIVVGLMCCVGAYAIFRAARDNIFATQFGLAASLAGQGLVIYGLVRSFESAASMAALVILAFEALLAAVVPNFTHRVLCSLGALVALWYVLALQGVSPLLGGVAACAFALVWLNEFALAARGSAWRAIGYGMALGMVQFDAAMMWGGGGFFGPGRGEVSWLAHWAPQLGSLLAAGVLVYAVLRLLARESVAAGSRAWFAALIAALLVATSSYPAPGVLGALLIMLLGFANGNRVLLGLGIIALGAFLTRYYYALQASLLDKSMVLAATGVVLLGVRLVFLRVFASAENSHA